MFKCSGCHKTFCSVNTLVKHIREKCHVLAASYEFKCGQVGCHRSFTSVNSLRKHLTANHLKPCKQPASSSFHNDSLSETIVSNEPTIVAGPSSSQNDSASSTQSMTMRIAGFLSLMYSFLSVPRNTIQVVVNELSKLLTTSKEVILNNLKHSFESDGIPLPTELECIVGNVVTDVTNSILPLQTEYKRFQFYEEIGTLFPPIEVTVGERLDSKRTQIGISLVPKPCTMQIIPIAGVLQKFLSIDGLLKEIFDYQVHLEKPTGIIENIVQGSIWKKILAKHDNDSTIYLPLILYYDDFETGNPLGSHATIHKLGGVYLSLPFLPSHYVSKLNHIFMLALFHSSDRIAFGNKMIFQKVIEQLNFLHNNGIYVATDVYKGVIKFSVVCFSGDNLGLNSMLGFVESFVANYCCRICIANKQQIQTMLFEDKQLLRNIENYKQGLLENDVSKTGIKEKCIFIDTLDSFNIFENVSVDILHDFFEGCCRYIMSYVFNYLVVDSKLVPLNILENRLTAFDYGPDSGSKPTNCVALNGNVIKLKTSAAEMSTLVRYFGLIIGYYVPTSNLTWELYIYLRKIMDKLTNPRVSMDSVEQLRFLVASLNETYLKVTKQNLKPKFHNLLHYPDMLLKFGPLTQVWTMRFEAKHRVSKIASRASSNRLNICKTVALRNQLVLNHVLLNGNLSGMFSCSKKTKLNIDTKNVVQKHFNLETKEVFKVSWVQIKGNKLQISSIVTVDICNQSCMPVFAEMNEIYVTDDDCVFCKCTMMETVDFDFHFFAYNVRKTQETILIEPGALYSFVPNTLTVMADLKLYVTLRVPID